jgi:ADP-heptose:LPS heptosyltransferase
MLPYYDKIRGIHKIAVLRANALGDFLFTLPALEALRTTYPDAEIVLLAKEWHHAFLAHRPSPVDRVIVVPPYGGVSEEPGFEENPAELDRFFQQMQREQFDLAIQIHGGGRYSNPFLLRLGASMTVGLKTPDATPLDRWMPYIYFQHEVLRYLEVVSLVGATTTRLEPRIQLTQEDLAESRRAVPDTEQPLIALHPGASDPRRRWPPTNFAAVGDTLAAMGAQIVVTGTADERGLTEAVVKSMQAPASDLAGHLSLGGLAGLYLRCRVLISNDSGPLHLGGAVGTSTVGIYWGFNMVNACPLTRSRHRPLVSWQLLCPICGHDYTYGKCPHEVSLVESVPINEAIEEAKSLLVYP